VNEHETEEVGPVTQILKAIITAIISAIGIGLFGLFLVWSVGCSTPAQKVLGSVNNYEFYTARYPEQCPVPTAPMCPEKRALLRKWSGALDEAGSAIKRGGALPLQLERLGATEKEYPK
jgi:hypothetical protein